MDARNDVGHGAQEQRARTYLEAATLGLPFECLAGDFIEKRDSVRQGWACPRLRRVLARAAALLW